MSVFPSKISEMIQLHNRVRKFKLSAIFENEKGESQDFVSISLDAKKKEIITKAKSEILEKLREAEKD